MIHFLQTVGGATDYGQVGIVAIQVLLLWRVRVVEKEQRYQAVVGHWVNGVLQQIAWNMKVKLEKRPERNGG